MDNTQNVILAACLLFAVADCNNQTQPDRLTTSNAGEIQSEVLTIPGNFEGVSALAVNPRGHIYAGDRRGRLPMSVDGGKIWSPLIDRGTGGGSICEGWNCEARNLNLDQTNPGRLFLTKVDSDWRQGGGFFRSGDGGQTWRRVGPDWFYGGAIALAPQEAGPVYFGTDEGLFRSTDDGENWRKVLPGDISDVAISSANSSVVYAVGNFVHRSEDAGTTWEDRSDGLFSKAESEKQFPEGHPRITEVAVDPENTDRLYVAAVSDLAPERVFQSRDAGRTWAPVGFAGQQVNTLEIDPRNPQTVYVGCGSKLDPEGTYVSRDAGQTWEIIHDVGSSMSLAFDPTNDNVVYEGTNFGLYRHVAAVVP